MVARTRNARSTQGVYSSDSFELEFHINQSGKANVTVVSISLGCPLHVLDSKGLRPNLNLNFLTFEKATVYKGTRDKDIVVRAGRVDKVIENVGMLRKGYRTNRDTMKR